MGIHLGRFVGLTLLAGLASAPAAHASPRISVNVGIGVPAAPVIVAPVARPGYARAVRPGYVWQPGHYVWTRVGYRWMAGAWIPAPYDYRVQRRDWDRRRDWDDRRGWDHRRDWDDRDRDRSWRR